VHDIFEFKIEGQIIMRGSSGIPKSDINSALVPDSTASTDAELKNSTETYKRLKTHKPPSVREKERAQAQGDNVKTGKDYAAESKLHAPSSRGSTSPLSSQDMNQHTAPVVSSSRKNSHMKSETHTKANDIKEIAVSLALRIQPAMVEKELNQLEIVMKGLEDNNLRFNRPPLVNYSEIKEFIRTGIIRVIEFKEGAISDQAEDLLIRMIRLGCDPNVADKYENSVLMFACKAGRSALVKVLLTECPDLRKDWLNVHGQNAAMMAYKYDNSQLYLLLEEAGISRHPENPALYMYLSSFQITGDDSTDSETDDYLDLFEENNFMNLADVNGQTLLFHAVIHEDVDFVTFLCKQKKFPNVSLRDRNQKSVFDYIKQIKDPEKKKKISDLIYNLSLETGSLQQLAKYTYSGGVLKKY
jgi:ankyrin repeat protein